MSHRLAILIITLSTCATLLPAAASAASSSAWSWPLDDREVGARFDPPASPYGSGHRGVDLPASVGDTVRAVAPGRVTFAGQVGGVGVVTIDHGSEKSTYQPVKARVRVGDAVTNRQAVGTLLGTHSHCPGACLHLGRKIERTYLDPLELLRQGRFELIDPEGAPPPPPVGVGGTLQRPVGGPVTSAFGMRVHPITGERKLHDGTDFGVPCGTPVRAAASGVVSVRASGGPYGTRLTIRHGSGLETTYNHLTSQGVSVGDRVSVGDVIARSGSTGRSTGCHLHFMVLRDGRPTDPQALL